MTRRIPGIFGLLLIVSGARADLFCSRPDQTVAHEVRSGEPLRHRFVVRNKGTNTIDIKNLKPGCGCLRPRIDRMRLEPGTAAMIDVEVNTVTQAEGRNNWRVTVFYLDGGEVKELYLTLSADIKQVVSIQPATLVVYTATAFSQSLTLIEKTDLPIKIMNTATTSPHVRVCVGSPTRSGNEWRRTIRLDILPSFPEGRLEDVLCLYTHDAVFAELRFPFAIVKRSASAVHAAPAAVQLTANGMQALPARIVLLSRADDVAVSVDRIETDHPAIHCTWAAGPEKRATLRVGVTRGDLPALPFQSKIRVHLHDKSVIEVPVIVD